MDCTKLLFLCADSRFAKPRSSLKKVLIVTVRNCRCGALIRGLENLEVPLKGFNCCGAKLRLRCADSRFAEPRSFPAKGTFFVLFACTKSTKSTPEVCEPLDSGDDSKLCRKRFCKAFRRLMSKPVLPAKRRRKGFESVRKGYRSADARLMFFGKEIVYCKLTVGCRR